jgi:hypothetical protein
MVVVCHAGKTDRGITGEAEASDEALTRFMDQPRPSPHPEHRDRGWGCRLLLVFITEKALRVGVAVQ